MLSGHVNKYLNERSNFNTEVCQYNFGLGDERNVDTPDPKSIYQT